VFRHLVFSNNTNRETEREKIEMERDEERRRFFEKGEKVNKEKGLQN
jgi:hypothetical protein